LQELACEPHWALAAEVGKNKIAETIKKVPVKMSNK
jgi:hypothetical protein